MSRSKNLQRWIDFIEKGDHAPAGLQDILADDVVFQSPVVHTPQRGKAITTAYLSAAGNVLGGESFKYVREFDCGDRAVLEFTSEIDGIIINGVDMIEWDAEGKISDFKVMVRPLKAIQKVHALMAQMLEAMKSKQ